MNGSASAPQETAERRLPRTGKLRIRGLACASLKARLLRRLVQGQYLCAMLVGYARISTSEQDAAAQTAALKAAGCERIFREEGSGGCWYRPELRRLFDQLRSGDVLVVCTLDRLSRSLRDLLILMERLGSAQVGFRSLTEAVDTTTVAGHMLMKMVGTFAEFERAMLRERTRASLKAAYREGRAGGSRPKLSDGQRAEILRLVEGGEKTAAAAARLFRIHPATVGRLLAQERARAKNSLPGHFN